MLESDDAGCGCGALPADSDEHTLRSALTARTPAGDPSLAPVDPSPATALLQPSRAPAPNVALVTGEGAGADIVPADTSTPYTLAIGDSVSGFVNTASDHDWYRVNLVAGQSYRFTMDATSGGLDCFLEMRDANGNLLAIDDDSGASTNSDMVFLCTQTGTYYVSAQCYTDPTQSSTGGYTLTSSTAPPPNILHSIDWGTQLSTNVVLVYFANPGEVFDGVSSLGWNAYEKQQAMLALQQISNVCNVSFAITTDPSQATFKLVTTTSTEYSAYMNPPGTFNEGVGVFARNASGWDENGGGGLEIGGRGFAVLLHEFGHGLGMAHPHDNGGSSDIMQRVLSATGSYGLYDLNQGVNTMMTYNFGWQVGPNGVNVGQTTNLESTPMALDVALLQQKYGANTSYHTGNDTYILGASPSLVCIWDAGGTDAIAYAGASNCTIDLRPATIDYTTTGGGPASYIAGQLNAFTIAQGVVIENASAGSGNDTLVGNSADNVLTGGAGNDNISGGGGNDTLTGGAGADTIDGGAGQDTAVFGEVYANYQVTIGASSVTVKHLSDGETDTITNVETLSFTDKQVLVTVSSNSPPTAPADSNAAANAISEGALTGDVVAGLSIASTDADAGDKITYSLTDDAGGRFAINATTGVVTVKDASLLNYETAASHQIKVQATDGKDVSSVSTFTISVTDVAPSAPVDGDSAANTIADNAVNGAVVAGLALTASDVHGGTVTYGLADDAGGRFAINSATGVVTVKDASLLNTASSHQIQVWASDGTMQSAASTFTINVTNSQQPPPTFSIGNAGTVSEGGSAVFTVTMSGSISAPTTIWYSTIDGTATAAAGDFAAVSSKALTFNPGGPTSQQISIPILIESGNPAENAESFSVGLQSAQGGAVFTSGSATIAANGGTAPPTFSISNAGVVSEGSSAVFTVTMTGSISAPTTIWYSTANGTASSTAGDFTAITGQPLTFNPGGPTSQQITVPILVEPNNPPENAETFYVNLLSTQFSRPFATGSATIAANGGAGPSFSIGNAGSVTEGGNAVFTVTMTGSISAPTTVWYSTIDGSATAGAGDFAAVSGNTLTFNPGGPTTQQIIIPTLIEAGNPLESNETFSVGLQASQGGAAYATGTATILANGTAPTFSISGAGTVSEGGNAVFTVTMTGAINTPTTVWYSTIDGTATAAAGDFTAVNSQALTFIPGGPTSQQVSIPILIEPGNPAENAESFSVGLQASQGGAVFTSNSATIAANGSAAPSFSIGNAGTVSEGGNAVFTVTMTGSISAPVTIWYSTIDGTATAAAGDFAAVNSQALTFNPGGPTSQQVSIPILIEPGNPVENAENFSVGLQSTQGGAAFTTGSATIAANGSSGGGPTFSISNAGTVVEGGNAVFTVTMTGSISAPTTVWYSTINATASATAGDFAAVTNQALTFNPGGPTTQQIVIPILIESPNSPETSETFKVGLQATSGGAAFTTGTATIQANGSRSTSAPFEDAGHVGPKVADASASVPAGGADFAPSGLFDDSRPIAHLPQHGALPLETAWTPLLHGQVWTGVEATAVEAGWPVSDGGVAGLSPHSLDHVAGWQFDVGLSHGDWFG